MGDVSIDSKSIVQVDFLNETIAVSFGFLGSGRQIEIEVSHLTFVGSVSVEDDDGICFRGYPLGQQVLAYRCPDGGDVEGFRDCDDFLQIFQSLLCLIDELCVVGADVLCDFPGVNDVRPFLHADRERFEGFPLLLEQMAGDAGDQTRI